MSFEVPKRTFAVGPSELMPNVREYMAEGVELSRLSHRPDNHGDQFQGVVEETTENIRLLLNIPPEYTVAFVGSATNAMNLVAKNLARTSAHIFVNGAFSERSLGLALKSNKFATATTTEWGTGFNLLDPAIDEIIEEAEPEVISITQNETSTGVAIDTHSIRTLKIKHPDVFISVDLTSANPYAWVNADVLFWSVQKLWGLPAGLGVLAYGPEALAKSIELENAGFDVGGYQSFGDLAKAAANNQTPETPNMAAIYTLGKVAADMRSYGIDRLRANIDKKAEILYEFFEKFPGLTPFVSNKPDRSPTTLVVEVASGALALQSAILERFKVDIGTGYGDYKDQHIRIGNFPAHSIIHVQDLLGMIEAVVDH